MHKPTKTAGKAGDTVTLVVSRSYEAVKASAPDTHPHPGKLNYQAKPRKAAKPEARRPELVEKKIYGRARYIGDGTGSPSSSGWTRSPPRMAKPGTIRSSGSRGAGNRPFFCGCSAWPALVPEK